MACAEECGCLDLEEEMDVAANQGTLCGNLRRPRHRRSWSPTPRSPRRQKT